ncbi:MAG TPA: bifunctional serine/threonine-protein kinase/universal stress protein [Burkholderiales bacterium]|nr:bifunctional serine/threonine-protein kinase/universal stress protein [Burkholderiales bacterium]
MDLAAGAELGGFRVLHKAHEGSMAVLYRVERGGESLPLVMKVPKLSFGSHPACYVGFEVEQMVLAALAGPHVPRLVARGDLATEPWLVMEWIEGPRLADSAARAPLPAEEVARLGVALASALHGLHRQNVLHLDLKASNVVFRPSGEAVLVDFGLARHLQLPDLVEEEFHAPVGTGAYISPEQVRGLRDDPRSDLFALGVVLYQLATGALPFGSPTTRAAFARRLYLDPRPPRQLNPRVPEWLQEVILHCLEPRAEDRYASAAQVAHDLAHPQQVPVTERGRRARRRGAGFALRRWVSGLREAPAPVPGRLQPAVEAAHLLVAVDLSHSDPGLSHSMREAVRCAATAALRCRVTFVTVQEPVFTEDPVPELEHTRHTESLVALRHWAAPLELPPQRVRYHVLQGSDAAAALLEWAARHHVDHILMGARGHSALRRFLGSVSARVVAEAPCTVTAVRAPPPMPD